MLPRYCTARHERISKGGGGEGGWLPVPPPGASFPPRARQRFDPFEPDGSAAVDAVLCVSLDSLDARVVFVPFFPSWGPVATILSIRAWQKKKKKKRIKAIDRESSLIRKGKKHFKIILLDNKYV